MSRQRLVSDKGMMKAKDLNIQSGPQNLRRCVKGETNIWDGLHRHRSEVPERAATYHSWKIPRSVAPRCVVSQRELSHKGAPSEAHYTFTIDLLVEAA